MQERIGWLFSGTARLFPGHGYFQTQTMIVSTYLQYQQKMPDGLEVGPLLALAKQARADHPMRLERIGSGHDFEPEGCRGGSPVRDRSKARRVSQGPRD